MENRKTIFDFLGSVFMIYGITITMLLMIIQMTGDASGETSNMFSLGSEGLTSLLLLQFLIISFVIIGLQYLFFSERMFRDMSQSSRIIGMLGSILVLMSIMILLFDWFPEGEIISWVLFVSFFMASFGVSIAVISIKERMENRQMAEGLSRYKAQLKKEKDNA